MAKKNFGNLDDLDPAKLFSQKGEAKAVDHTAAAEAARAAPTSADEELKHLTVDVTKRQRNNIHGYARDHDTTAREVMVLGFAAVQHLERELGSLDAVRDLLAQLVEESKR